MNAPRLTIRIATVLRSSIENDSAGERRRRPISPASLESSSLDTDRVSRSHGSEMPFSPKAVANSILTRCWADGISASPLKLQKLVYYAHGWHLAVVEQKLINRKIEAWKFGPVVPTLFHEFKEFGNQPIERLATTFEEFGPGPLDFAPVEYTIESEAEKKGIPLHPLTIPVIDRVLEEYGKISAAKLSNMTHEKDGPWDRIWNAGPDPVDDGTDIPNELIKAHFKASYERHLAR